MINGWNRKRLGELAELNGRIGWRGLTAKEYTKSGPMFLSVHSLNYGDYVDFRDAFHISEDRYAESPEIMLQKDDVLICKDGAGIGKVGIVGNLPDRATINSSLLLVRSGKEIILPKFLYRCLSSPYFQNIVSSRLNGATTPHLYQRDITEFPVVVPPLPEQKRIVGILDEAFDGIATTKANAERNLQNARVLFESHLQSIFAERRKGWVEKRLGDVTERLTNGYVGPTRNIYHGSGVPYLLARHVKNGRLAFDGRTFVSDQFNRKNKKSMLKAGDVLLVQSGHIGHAAVVTEEHEGHNCHAMIVITPVKNALTGSFLSLHFRSSGMKQKFEEIRSGSTVPHLTCGAVKELTIAIPDLPTQRGLVTALQEVETEIQRLESIYRRKLAALDALKKSLLHQAFSGAL